jgi:gliding motility-associated-like protein
MKNIIILLIFATISCKSFSQCSNADFSMGITGGGWTGTTGTYALGVYTATGPMKIGITNSNSYAADTGRQTLMTLPATDPETQNQLSVLPPGGGYSVRLGNPRTASCDGGPVQEEQLSYTYLVTAANYIFTYQYAVVLHDPGNSPGHTALTRPKFSIQVLNSQGALVDSTCGYYEVVAQQGNPGFNSCNPDPLDLCDNTDQVVWKNWTSVSVDLSSYIGQNITIQFATRDCNPNEMPGKHFGYAYISCYCGIFSIIQQCVGTSDVVTAPAGYVSYQWTYINTLGTTTNITTTTNTLTINPVPNGQTITCVATSATGCSFTYTLPLAVSVPVFTPAAPSICQGGTANITVSGLAPYNYVWSNGVSDSIISVSPTSSTTYTVTATAAGGCSSSGSVTVTVLNNPVVTVSPDTAICSAGSATLTASGATTYTWAPNTGLSSTTGATVIANPTSDVTYTVTGISGSCSATNQVTVHIINNPVVTASPPVSTVCPTQSVTLTANGGTTYIWTPDIGLSATTGASVIATPPATQVYTVTGSFGGCTSSASVTVNIINNLPMTITPNSSICIGGSIPLSAGGATNYVWSPATGLSVTTGAMVMANPTITTAYTVTGTSNGCSNAEMVTVTVNPLPVITVVPPLPLCPGASTPLQASGAITYIWSPSTGLSATIGAVVTANPTVTSTYRITGTDANGCTGSTTVTVTVAPITADASETDENCGQANGTATANGGGNCLQTFTYLWNTTPYQQNTRTAINLTAGTYTVTVSCGACIATASTTVHNLAGPSVAIINYANATCGYSNGGATALATGNNPPFIYKWSNSQSGNVLTQVIAGTYHVSVTDAVGCTAENSIVITDTPGPDVNVTGITTADCGLPDGASTINVTGGTPLYTFQWNSNPVQTTQNILNVPKGDYCVTVTDAIGCTTSICVIIGQKPGPTATVISQNEICNQADGTATAHAMGGAGSYTYLWSNGETDSIATGLTQGTYTVTVSDEGCSTSKSVTVLETSGPIAAFTANPQILTILDGPVFFWDNSTGNIVNWVWIYGDGTANGSGNYTSHPYPNIGTYIATLIITDKNGCKDTAIDTIIVRDIFTFYIPNSFTPNGDSYNDYFTPKGLNIDPNNYNEYIYDRWGNMVFQTNKWDSIKHQAGELWNGTVNNRGTFNDVVMDVYVYKIILREFNNGPEHEYVGRITIVP